MASFNSNQSRSNTAVSTSAETAQTRIWNADFGREYTDRNTFEVENLDSLYSKYFGITRTAINQDFLRTIPQDATFLEVGCNAGNQVLFLQQMGYTNLSVSSFNRTPSRLRGAAPVIFRWLKVRLCPFPTETPRSILCLLLEC